MWSDPNNTRRNSVLTITLLYLSNYSSYTTNTYIIQYVQHVKNSLPSAKSYKHKAWKVARILRSHHCRVCVGDEAIFVTSS
jgi:hypothetical protein